MKTKNKIVIFDIDDTLYNEIDYVKSGYQVVAKYIENDYKLNNVYDKLLKLFNVSSKNVFNRLLDKYNIKYNNDTIKKYIEIYRNHKPNIELSNNIIEVLNELRKDNILALISDGNYNTQLLKCNSLELEKYFDDIVLTDYYGKEYWKPSIKCFDMLSKKYNINYNNIYYVGDNPNKDFYISKYGINTIRYYNNKGIYFNDNYLDDIKEKYKINDYKELKLIINGGEKMNILIIANYVNFPWEIGNCRFIYLSNLLSNSNNVELITSNFNHIKKKKRNIKDIKSSNLKFKITLIDEPGYHKNVSIKRIYSHKILSMNLKKYLNQMNYKPDIIYCSIPSLDVASVAEKYANKNNIRFILDIQDLWPESFKMVLNIPFISNIIFLPMKIKANHIYSNSNDIVAVSDTYVKRAMMVKNSSKKCVSVYLGTDLRYFDECKNKNIHLFNDKFIRIAYIGTLGTSYDLKSVIDAINKLKEHDVNNLLFVVMGDGPLKEEFENYAKLKKVKCEFTGRLEYDKMVGLLCSCDIAVNPIVGSSAASIINKVGDYAASGLPVLNTQNSEEYKKLLEFNNAGLNCENGNIYDIAKKLEFLVMNEKERKEMGINNRKIAEKLFDRKITYKKILNLINNKDKNGD